MMESRMSGGRAWLTDGGGLGLTWCKVAEAGDGQRRSTDREIARNRPERRLECWGCQENARATLCYCCLACCHRLRRGFAGLSNIQMGSQLVFQTKSGGGGGEGGAG